jgi:histidyl-tRNA synthetase
VDRLTAAGRLVGLHVEPEGDECDLLARALRTPGAAVPLHGFGSSDCRRCPAHLAAVPSDFDPRVSLL